METQIPSKFLFRRGLGKIEDDLIKQLGQMYDDLFIALSNLERSIFILNEYADNTAAIAGGLVPGQLYRNGDDPDVVCIVH